jgi:hypothetical protein
MFREVKIGYDNMVELFSGRDEGESAHSRLPGIDANRILSEHSAEQLLLRYVNLTDKMY